MQRFKSILISLLSLVLLVVLVIGVLTGEKGINIERTDEVTETRVDEREPEHKPPILVLRDLFKDYGPERFDEFRQEAVGKGLYASLDGYMIKLEERFRWVNRLGTLLQYCCLSFLLLAAGPLWVRKRLAGHEDRNRQALALVPYFLAVTTAVFFMAGQMIGLITALQGAQIGMATLGSPPIAITNDFLLYLRFMGADQLAATHEIITTTQTSFAQNPLEGLGAMENLMNGLSQIQESSLLSGAFVFVGFVGRLGALYGPAIAIVTLALMYTTIAPILRELVGYPMRVAKGTEEAKTGEFTKKIFRLFWQETKALFYGLWSLFWVLLLGVLCMHFLCFPVVVASIQSLQVSLASIHNSSEFNELAWFAGLVSMASYLMAGFLVLMVPMGMSVKQSYAVARDKVIKKRTFKDYQHLLSLRRMIYRSLVPRTLLAAVITVVVYLGGIFVLSGAAVQLWWMALSFGFIFFGALWWLKPWCGFWRLYQLAGRLDLTQTLNEELEGEPE